MTEVALKWKRDRPGRQVTTLGWFVVEIEDPAPAKGPLSWAAIVINPVGKSPTTVTLGVFPTMRAAKARCQVQADVLGDFVAVPNVSDDTEGVLGPPDQPPPPVYTGEEPWSIQRESGLFVDGIGPYEIRSPPDTPVNDQGVARDAGMTERAETPLAELFPELVRSHHHYRLMQNYGCPTCRARRGKPCRTKTGSTASRPHSKRLAKMPTLRDDELPFRVNRPCPNCGGTEIAGFEIPGRNKWGSSDRHIFECADCEHVLGYYDKPK